MEKKQHKKIKTKKVSLEKNKSKILRLQQWLAVQQHACSIPHAFELSNIKLKSPKHPTTPLTITSQPSLISPIIHNTYFQVFMTPKTQSLDPFLIKNHHFQRQNQKEIAGITFFFNFFILIKNRKFQNNNINHFLWFTSMYIRVLDLLRDQKPKALPKLFFILSK